MFIKVDPKDSRTVILLKSKEFREPADPKYQQALHCLVNVFQLLFIPFRQKLQEFVDLSRKKFVIGNPVLGLIQNIQDPAEGLPNICHFKLEKYQSKLASEQNIFPILDLSFPLKPIMISSSIPPQNPLLFIPHFVVLQEELWQYIPSPFIEDSSDINLTLQIIEIWARELRFINLRFHKVFSQKTKLCSPDVALFMAQKLIEQSGESLGGITEQYCKTWFEMLLKKRPPEEYPEYNLSEAEKLDIFWVGLLSALSWLNLFATLKENTHFYCLDIINDRIIWWTQD